MIPCMTQSQQERRALIRDVSCRKRAKTQNSISIYPSEVNTRPTEPPVFALVDSCCPFKCPPSSSSEADIHCVSSTNNGFEYERYALCDIEIYMGLMVLASISVGFT
ncbi:hypothetical protein JTE90_029347 [Oedothorax gibbosus]|uniref:Uncharacterized protein n=1 Tax=Oedothorax gibbosus TaxID=931172 RepID=A0AAV6UDW1_9ARAC|nr:hypothetical protein JTE90_029347 [Oedothorax gibbosus]